MRTAEQKAHLQELFDLMAFDEDRERFSMMKYQHSCGTPACLLGHAWRKWPAISGEDFDMNSVTGLFGLSTRESIYLFGARSPDGSTREYDTPEIAAQRVLDILLADADWGFVDEQLAWQAARG